MNAFNPIQTDCKLVLSIAKVESSLNPKAIGSSHEEVGLFQLRPEFHKCASFEPAKNARCAISYLKMIKKRHYTRHGPCYVVYYNYGPNSKIKNPCEKDYFRKVSSE